MMRTRFGERLPLGNKPPGQRLVGFNSTTAGAGKRQPSIPSVTGAPAASAPFANQALPGKPSRGLATNFGARGIAPFRPGSKIGTKTAYQPLTLRRSLPFLETTMPSMESPQVPGFVREPAAQPAPINAVSNGTVSKLAKVARRKSGFRFPARPGGGLTLDG